MKAIANCVLVVVGMCAVVVAQGTEPKSQGEEQGLRRLALAGTVTVESHTAQSTQIPIKCDGEGNIFVRFFHGTSPQKEPIHKFNKKGEEQASYSLASDAEFEGKGKGAVDFAIGKDGEVYELAISEKGAYIVSHAKDGGIKSKTRLETNFFPHRFAVFDSGQFLITGVGFETKDNPAPHFIFTAIFDERGKLLRKITPEEDKAFEEAADRGDAEFVEPGQLGGGNFAVELGTVARGSDGNLYIVRRTIPVRVYAIAPTGEVVRSFEVKPDLERKVPSAVSAYAGKLAIEFVGDENDNRSFVKLVSLEGKEYASYDTSRLGMSFGCYSEPRRFTFLSGQEKLQLSFASPQ